MYPFLWLHSTEPRGRLNIKKSSYQYRDSHVKDKTVSPTVLSLAWESLYLGKTVFILRRAPGHLAQKYLWCSSAPLRQIGHEVLSVHLKLPTHDTLPPIHTFLATKPENFADASSTLLQQICHNVLPLHLTIWRYHEYTKQILEPPL